MRALVWAHWPWAAGYVLVMSLLAFALMGVDKRRAKRKGARRIPERTLFLTALLGGSLGAALACGPFGTRPGIGISNTDCPPLRSSRGHWRGGFWVDERPGGAPQRSPCFTA